MASLNYFVYILYSKSLNKYYVGYSQDPNKRLLFHNSLENKIWTSRGRPWLLAYKIMFESKTDALKAEKFIKKAKSRKFIENIIQNGWKSI